MKRQSVCLFILTVAWAITSCKKTTEKVSATFDENVRIKMTETVDSVKRTLSLTCYTEKIFECSNYRIEANYFLSNDKITINFIKIAVPGICLTSPAPASIIIDLDKLANKNYEMELNFPADKITGQLDVTPESYISTLPVQTKVQFINPDLKRVPANSIYGTVHYHSAATNPIVQKFIDTLQLLGAIPMLYPPGDYGQFQIDSSGQIKQIQDLGYYFTRYFIFDYSNDSGPLRALVKRFGSNYRDLLLVTLNTTKGEIFYSWAQ